MVSESAHAIESVNAPNKIELRSQRHRLAPSFGIPQHGSVYPRYLAYPVSGYWKMDAAESVNFG